MIAPVVALRASPGGRAPAASVQVYGDVPPVAASVCEYAVPASPEAREGVVMLRAGVTVMERDLVAVWGVGVVESVTWMVKV